MDGNRDKLSKKGIDKFTKSWRHLPHFQSPNSVYFITSRCRFHQSGQQIELLPVERDIVFEAIKFLMHTKGVRNDDSFLPNLLQEAKSTVPRTMLSNQLKDKRQKGRFSDLCVVAESDDEQEAE